MSGESARVVDTRAVAWRAFDDAPGVSYKTLNKTPEGSLTLLLRFEPGASYPTHTHPAGEEYFVVSGELDDVGGPYSAGSFVYHAPGSTHTPKSAKGCEVLVFLSAPIERHDVGRENRASGGRAASDMRDTGESRRNP